VPKIINFRLLFFASAAVLSGSLVAYAVISERYYLIAFSAVILAFLIYSLFASEITKRTRLALSVVLPVIVLAFSGAGLLNYHTFIKNNPYGDRPVEVTGRVTDYVLYEGEGFEAVVIDDLRIDGQKTLYKAAVTVSKSKYGAGDRILAKACYVQTADGRSFPSQEYRLNIKFRISGSDVSLISEGSPNLLETVRARLQTGLSDNLTKTQADTAFALLTGDRSDMDFQTSSAFMFSGLAHVLAVSGLHISFLISAVSRLLKKLRTNRFLHIAVITVTVTAFCALCGFSPSALRAAIMGLAGAVAYAFFLKSDMLTNLSLAVIVLLAARPLYIMDAGFIMSMTTVFAIACIARRLAKALGRIHTPKIISASVSVTTASTVGIFPFTSEFFGTQPVYALLFNLVLVPVYMLIFTLLLIVSVPVAVFPQTAALYRITQPFLYAAEGITALSGRLPAAVLTVFPLGIFAGVYLLCMFGTSRYILVRGHVHKALTVTLAAVMLAAVIAGNLPAPYENNRLTNSAVIIVDDGKGATFVIGEVTETNYRGIKEFFIENRRRGIDYILLTRVKEGDFPYINYISVLYGVKGVVMLDFDRGLADSLYTALSKPVTASLPRDASGTDFAPQYRDGALRSIEIRSENKKILYLPYGAKPSEFLPVEGCDTVIYGGAKGDAILPPGVRTTEEYFVLTLD
jgi:ComEC/Rec2-related protein